MYDYDSHGAMTIRDSSGVEMDESAVGNAYGFTGRRLDVESGLYYFRTRYFDVELGRFITVDPLGYVDGFGLYGGYFVGNGVDPFGLFEPPGELVSEASDFWATYQVFKVYKGEAYEKNVGERYWKEKTFIKTTCGPCFDGKKRCYDNYLVVHYTGYRILKLRDFELLRVNITRERWFEFLDSLEEAVAKVAAVGGAFATFETLNPAFRGVTSATEKALQSRIGAGLAVAALEWQIINEIGYQLLKDHTVIGGSQELIDSWWEDKTELYREEVRTNGREVDCCVDSLTTSP